MIKHSRKFSMKLFLEELLLYSGQFGLFYIVMQFIIEKQSFFSNPGHIVLLVSLVVQASILAKVGNINKYRFVFSFFVPIVYSIFEIREGFAYILNAAHIGFWIYALISSLLMIVKEIRKDIYSKLSEMILVIINVLIFIFIYFYFDTWKDVKNNELLTIQNIFNFAPVFLSDPTHWFIILGGLVLAITVALGRYDISSLKEKIYSLFGQYVDHNVRDQIIQNGQMISKRLKLCILFSDIKNFTVLCENNDPGSITQMLNIYFEQWNSIVKKNNGTIDKYIGDAIMVIFGLENPGSACNSAISCSLEMNDKWNNLADDLKKRNLPVPEGYGIGCHFGDLIVGDIGSSSRKNFTVIGDTVNIASRLEAATRKIDSQILISSVVYKELDDRFKKGFVKVGMLDLKGKQERIEAWGLSKNDVL